jgi:hypothetical protein
VRIQSIVVVLFAVLGVCHAGAAWAQPRDAAIFVDAAAFSNTGWHTGVEYPGEEGRQIPNLNGTVAGGSGTIGTWLTPRFSIRFEFAALGNLESSTTYSTGSVLSGLTPVLPPPLLTVPVLTESLTSTIGERTAAVLAGVHTARRHGVQLGYLGGVVFVAQTVTNVTTETVTGFPNESNTVRSHSYGATAEVGMDADIALGNHFSVVPEVRLVADGVSVRLGVALRARW